MRAGQLDGIAGDAALRLADSTCAVCQGCAYALLLLAAGLDLHATFQQLLPFHYIWENAEPLQD